MKSLTKTAKARRDARARLFAFLLTTDALAIAHLAIALLGRVA